MDIRIGKRIARSTINAGLFASLACFTVPAFAQAPALPIIMSDAELAAARAGFNIGGLEVRIGAEMRTYINGELALLTTFNWSDGPPSVDRWVSDILTPAEAVAVESGVLANGHLTMRFDGQPLFLANDGQTALLQRTDGALQNLIFNTANGQSLRQESDIAIGLSNYQEFYSSIAPTIAMGGLNDVIAWSNTNASGP